MAYPNEVPPPRGPHDLSPAVDGRLRELLAGLEGTLQGSVEELTGKLNAVADAAGRIRVQTDAGERLLQGVGRIEQASANAEATLTRIHRGLRNYRWVVVTVLAVWTATSAAGGTVAESEFGWAAGLCLEIALRQQVWEAHGAIVRNCYVHAQQQNQSVFCRFYLHPQTSPARQ